MSPASLSASIPPPASCLYRRLMQEKWGRGGQETPAAPILPPWMRWRCPSLDHTARWGLGMTGAAPAAVPAAWDLKSPERKSGSYRLKPNSTNTWPGEPLVVLSSCSPVLGSLDCDCLPSSAAFSPPPPPPNKEHFPKHLTCWWYTTPRRTPQSLLLLQQCPGEKPGQEDKEINIRAAIPEIKCWILEGKTREI